MPSTSKSNRRRRNNSKSVSKRKQEWRVKQPTSRNWLELPSDLMVNILQRIGVSDILENAQKVCTAWREVCKDPAMWKVIRMDTYPAPCQMPAYCQMFKHAVDRSEGQLVDLTIIGFCDQELLEYVGERSSQLRRLEIVTLWCGLFGPWGEALSKLSLLEELSIAGISLNCIDAVGRYCPLLKTLKWNQTVRNQQAIATNINDASELSKFCVENIIAGEIGEYLPGLTHLELIGSYVADFGLEAILDGCCHLESLDVRGCWKLDLKGDLWQRCSEQIKYLKLPHDSLDEGYEDLIKRFDSLQHFAAFCDQSDSYSDNEY